MYASINGTRIFFDVEGMGWVPDGPILREKPVCFVLHGGPGGDHTGYKPGLTPLSEHMQLVYIDNRGSGHSDHGPQESYSLENNVADIDALRRHLGLEKIVLHGHSYGGMVAQEYALRYPEHVAGLLLLTTSPSYEFLNKAKKIVEERGTPEMKEITAVLWEGKFESQEQLSRFYEIMAPLYAVTHNAQASEIEKQQSRDAKARSNRSFQALNEGFGGFLQNFDVRDQLKNINAPTLVMGARHDWITAVDESLEIAKRIPGSELVIFENSSHSVIKDEYEYYLSTVISFIKRRVLPTF
ncbi:MULTISPECIES: alpha/beta hydrolase [Brevibacillus]|uniref:Alpha/beta hydrolase n=1 Tax=Brevibacillus invocatus TaxID=173959 RepID=A0A3M8C8B8_9BACL|nr:MULTISPECIES: alpha/beta hydrolase [Brevibacillus]MCM3080706.1 alpha/beta hydrolase [Brevibacillus invocatus]MCM3430873.1 alpha/beta hydrolase [Brevibacillus invocatus]MDH4617814.1 alpha/beta hydrolase [Brevibacillus sp. AY1]RNB71962.1 alpha/beta hydrolase [Brevibacillus invocatus]